jgi:hypothetical protein
MSKPGIPNIPRAFVQVLMYTKVLRWKIVTAFDVATEVLLNVLSIAIVIPVQLTLRLKFQVVLAFLFRLPYVLGSVH